MIAVNTYLGTVFTVVYIGEMTHLLIVRNLLGWLETRLAQITLTHLTIA